MKEAIIIIRPNQYSATKTSLLAAGFSAMHSENVLGHGKNDVNYKLKQDKSDDNAIKIGDYTMITKKQITIVIRDQDVDKLVEAVMEVNSTSNSGDGKIFILPTEKVVRIRTKEIADNALV